MERISAENTSLNEFGLTPEIILSGERAEFDPEAKPNPRKNTYVRHDFAEKLVGAYADDLVAAYRVIEELESEVDELKATLSETSQAAETSTKQVRQMLKDDKEFAEAEKLLATFENQLETLMKNKEMDKETIANLNSQIAELIEFRDTVPQLKADVEVVLNNLRSYFEEEGITIPDVDDYDE